MTVKIAQNLKKERIFLNKNGEKTTEEGMFGQVESNLGTNPRTETSEQK